MEREKFIQSLQLAARKHEIELTEKSCDNLWKYKEKLIKWNEKINLTAITEDNDVIAKHFIDSLIVSKHIKKNDKLIDVGTGAGFPGIVLAIYFNDEIEVTLLDSLNKRCDFLKEVIIELNLKKTTVIHGRAEEFAHNIVHREKYDVAVARAVADLRVLLELLAGYVKVNGRVMAMKSSSLLDELKNSFLAIEKLNLSNPQISKYEIESKNEKIKRNILEIKKIKKTDDKYPRIYGKIKKNPL